MFYKRVSFDSNRWPFGKDGPLVVSSGTYIITSGSIKDYSSIYVAFGATLKIEGTYDVTTIGSRGPIVIDGQIISSNTSVHATRTATKQTPDGNTVTSSTGDQSNGGTGGNGWASVYLGGAEFNGRGGGGGGGWTGGGAGGQSGNTVWNDYTLGNGADGQDTANGFRQGTPGYGGGGGGGQGAGRGGANGSDQGGGGAGGGYPGPHALPVYIKTRSTITGIGAINFNGASGFNGGIGGTGTGTSGTGGNGGGGGGGGGGGAGGNGGTVWIYSKMLSVTVTSQGGNGGLAGAGGPGYGGQTGAGGTPGSVGSAGDITVVTLI